VSSEEVASDGDDVEVTLDDVAEGAAQVLVDAEGAESEGEEEVVEEVLDPLQLAELERDNFKDSLQRLQADFENYKKRVARNQVEEVARQSGNLVAKLLVVIDTLDLAQAHLQDSDDDAEAKALVAARAQLLEVLSKEGLVRVDAAEVSFDPEVHDAVMHGEATGEETETMVDEILRSGYVWQGQVLRPAMVKVRG
jgi:molecular chaperone GrpE